MSVDSGTDGIGRMLKVMRNVAAGARGNGIVLGEYLGDGKFKIGDHTFLKGEYLISEHLTDYTMKISLDEKTETRAGGSGYGQFDSHDHDVKWEEVEMNFKSTLKKGDSVICYQFGDEEFVIIDKVVS